VAKHIIASIAAFDAD